MRDPTAKRLSLSREQVRAVDRLAIEEFGMPGALLMENAGSGASRVARELLGDRTGCVHLLCGGGNNGGDGYVVARHLANAGCEVHVWECCDPARLRGDAALNRNIALRMGLRMSVLMSAEQLLPAAGAWQRGALLIDGLLGTGFEGELRPQASRVIEALCAAREKGGVPVLALDLPSGLDCDTGLAAGACVVADTTCTFVARKRGFDERRSRAYTGRVVVVSIGAPTVLLERVREL